MIFPGLTTRPGARASTLRTLTLMGGIVGLVLLVACANVANLLLFRNVTRRGSAAVRRALGASSGRIARAQLVESLVLAFLGSLAGLGVAWAITLALGDESLLGMPALEEFTVDIRVLAFAVGAPLVTTLLFGTLPAVLAGRFSLVSALREAGHGTVSRGLHVRSVMAASQVALSLSLLVGGVILTRTVSNLYAVDTGMTARNVVTLPVGGGRLEGDEKDVVREAVMSALAQVPGVETVAVGVYAPHGPQVFVSVQRADNSTEDESIRVGMVPTTPQWFDLLGVNSARGGPVSIREDTWKPDEVVLTESLARKLFGGAGEALGQTIRVRFGGWQEMRVVDVTSDIRYARSLEEPVDAFFVRFGTFPVPGMTFLARTASADASVLASIRRAVEQALPDVPVADPTLLSSQIDRIHSESRMLRTLLGILSIFAVALAGVGLYGVVTFAVAGRRHEFGLRIALGAPHAAIAELVARYAGSILLMGSAFGIGGGYVLSRALESRLFGLEALDPTSFGLAVSLFSLTAIVACWAPTRRAMKVDPMTVLKAD